MARKKTPVVKTVVKGQISSRLRQVRLELFGEHGGPELARILDLPARTWYNYETGVTVPAEVMLSFISHTKVDPNWLLNGEGQRYRENVSDILKAEGLSPIQMILNGVELLERTMLENSRRDFTGRFVQDNSRVGVELPLIELAECPNYEQTTEAVRETFVVNKTWVYNPATSVCVVMPNDAMHPILPRRSIALVDFSQKDPEQLVNRVVIAVDARSQPYVRWLEQSGLNYVLRAEQLPRQYPIMTFLPEQEVVSIMGVVVAIFNRFAP